LIDVSFRAWRADSSRYKLYVYFDPSLRNSGMHDSAWSNAGALLSSEREISSALISKPAFVEVNSGYFNESDFLTQLRSGKTPENYDRATDGNVVQVGRPSSPSIVFGQVRAGAWFWKNG
jgi:hypothetical protein